MEMMLTEEATLTLTRGTGMRLIKRLHKEYRQ